MGGMACDGTEIPISENETLFSRIGNTYGGDGETTFALPKVTGPKSKGIARQVCISLFGAYSSP